MEGGIIKLITLKGIKLFVRDEQPAFDDLHVVNEVITENCYRIGRRDVAHKTIIDIGANIGDFALLCWKLGAKKVIAYEPEPHNLELLKMNVQLNKAADKIEIKGCAAGKPGYTLIDDGSGHSQTGRTAGNKVRVESLNNTFDHCDLLKMDCEGGEYEIVEDMTDETFKKIDRIMGEFHSWRWEKEPKRHQRMVDKLEKYFTLGYYGFKNSNFYGVKK